MARLLEFPVDATIERHEAVFTLAGMSLGVFAEPMRDSAQYMPGLPAIQWEFSWNLTC
jgi:hypothetical protein